MFDFLFPDHPSPRDGLIETALRYMERGEYELARVPLEQLLELDPGDLEAYGYLGLIAHEEGDYDKAEDILRQGVESAEAQSEFKTSAGPQNGWFDPRTRIYLKLLTALARVCYVQQELDEVKDLVAKVLELNPTDNLNVRGLHGLVLHREGELDEAIRAYRSAEGTPEIAYNLGLALFDQGRHDEAVLAFREGFFTNCFIAPMILGEEPQRHFVTEAQNRSSEADARSFDLQCGDLWAGHREAIEFLARLWNDPVVELETEEYIRLVDELHCYRDDDEDDPQRGEDPPPDRGSEQEEEELMERLSSLRSRERLTETNPRILDRVCARRT